MAENVVNLDSGDFISDAPISGDVLPLIPPGVYEMRFMYHETANMFGKSRKIIFWFQVVEFGDYYGVKLARFYNADRIIGKQGRSGKFSIKRGADLLREFLNVFPDYRPPKRFDRIPISYYKNVIVRCRVDTCTKDSQQRDTHELLHYSVVKEILGIKIL